MTTVQEPIPVSIPTLFDISGIDRSAVVVPPDEIGRLNPQSGQMRHLDHVIWFERDSGRIVGVKHVTEDEFWVPGHIPGRPLLPGVIMIEAAAQLASVSFRLRTKEDRFLAFTRLDEVVFRNQVVPGDDLLILIEERKFNPRRFVCRAQGLVNDLVAFEATITGMAVNEDQGRG